MVERDSCGFRGFPLQAKQSYLTLEAKYCLPCWCKYTNIALSFPWLLLGTLIFGGNSDSLFKLAAEDLLVTWEPGSQNLSCIVCIVVCKVVLKSWHLVSKKYNIDAETRCMAVYFLTVCQDYMEFQRRQCTCQGIQSSEKKWLYPECCAESARRNTVVNRTVGNFAISTFCYPCWVDLGGHIHWVRRMSWS